MKARHWVVSGVIILALMGLGSRLINDPGDFFKQLVFGLIFISILFFGIRYIMNKQQMGSTKNRSYAKAVRQSKKHTNIKQNTSQTHKAIRKRPLRKRSNVQLRVIEGQKGKKEKNKNRAIH